MEKSKRADIAGGSISFTLFPLLLLEYYSVNKSQKTNTVVQDGKILVFLKQRIQIYEVQEDISNNTNYQNFKNMEKLR